MSSLSCEIVTTNLAELSAIDRLFGSAINQTLFHHPRFLSYHGPAKFPQAQWRHYLFSRNGNPVAFLPGAVVTDGDATFRSPYGSSLGGLVHEPLSFSKLAECLDLWWEDLEEQGISRAEVVLAPPPYSRPRACEAVEFKLNQLGFVLHEPELCLVVPVERAPEFPRGLLRDTAWQKYKQARAAGVTVRYSPGDAEELESFYPILVENRKRFGVTPTHSLEELLRIGDLFPEAMHLFLATVEEHPVAGILAFRVTPEVLNAFYTADTPEGRERRAMDLLLVELYQWALEHSVRWVDLGSSSFRLELHPTLTRFKESHGGEKFLRRRYVWHPPGEEPA